MADSVKKCVMVIDSNLPVGIIVNTSAIIGITLGKKVPEQVCPDVLDASQKTHLGIISIPVAMLKGDQDSLKKLREKLYNEEFSELIAVDFSDVAQCCNIYDEYVAKAAFVPEENHTYFGVAIYGDKKKVNKLTGFLPLLR